MKDLNQAQKDLAKAVEAMKAAKIENQAKSDFPEIKRTFTYKKSGQL